MPKLELPLVRLLSLIPFAAWSQAQASSLCIAGETTFFSCVAARGKVISVCGSSDLSAERGYLQYRIGASAEALELVYPTKRNRPSGLFEFGNEGFGAKSSARNLRFHVGSYTYVVYSATYAFGTDAAGVSYTREAKRPGYITCKGAVDEQSFHLLQNIGLPSIDRDEFEFGP
jgi:hypothetical protein